MYVVLVLLIVLYIAFKNSERIARWLKNVLFAGEVANVPAVTVGGTTPAGSSAPPATKGSSSRALGVGSPSGARVATVPAGGVAAKGFPRSAEERQQLLQLRKQQMVEEARRKYLEKLTGPSTPAAAASSSSSSSSSAERVEAPVEAEAPAETLIESDAADVSNEVRRRRALDAVEKRLRTSAE